MELPWFRGSLGWCHFYHSRHPRLEVTENHQSNKTSSIHQRGSFDEETGCIFVNVYSSHGRCLFVFSVCTSFVWHSRSPIILRSFILEMQTDSWTFKRWMAHRWKLIVSMWRILILQPRNLLRKYCDWRLWESKLRLNREPSFFKLWDH